MKYIYIILFAFIGLSCKKESLNSPVDTESKVDMSKTMESTILKGTQSYTIYLPKNYDINVSKKYPVLYLLHGMNQDYTDWATFGDLKNIADKAISKGNPEIIIVCPNGYNSLYVNTPSMQYEDFFIEEFIPKIENTYRILGDKAHRHLAGLSMGGLGATYLGFKYSDKFGSAYSMSGGFLFIANATIKAILDEKTAEELKKLPRYAMECGTEDDLVIDVNDELHQILIDKGVSHHYIRRNGQHNWEFWKECLPKALEFIK